MKYMRINLTKDVQDTYGKYYVFRDIKEDLINKLRNILCPQIWKLSIIKMTIFSQLIHRFNAVPIKTQTGCLKNLTS